MIWHEDGNILNEASDQVIATIFRGLYLFSTTGEIAGMNLSGMETALFKSMIGKIARDDEKYNSQAKENTIKGLITAVRRQAMAEGKKLSNAQARAKAEEIYYANHPAMADNSQPQPAAADSSQLTKRSVAEHNLSVSYPETISPPKAVAERSEAERTQNQERERQGEGREMRDVFKAASDKGFSISNMRIVKLLRNECEKTSCDQVYERLQHDQSFLDELRMLNG